MLSVYSPPRTTLSETASTHRCFAPTPAASTCLIHSIRDLRTANWNAVLTVPCSFAFPPRRDRTPPLPDAVFTFRAGDPQFDYWHQRWTSQFAPSASACKSATFSRTIAARLLPIWLQGTISCIGICGRLQPSELLKCHRSLGVGSVGNAKQRSSLIRKPEAAHSRLRRVRFFCFL